VVLARMRDVGGGEGGSLGRFMQFCVEGDGYIAELLLVTRAEAEQSVLM